MANQKKQAQGDQEMPLSKKNYKIILIGIALVFIGFLLMSGGTPATSEEFFTDIFSFRRITLAPLVVVIGFVVVFVGIMKKSR